MGRAPCPSRSHQSPEQKRGRAVHSKHKPCPAGSGSRPAHLCSRPGHPDDSERLSLSCGGALRGTPTPGERTSLTRAVHGSAVPRDAIRPQELNCEDARPLPAPCDHPTDRRTPPPSPVTGSCSVVPAGPDGQQRASAALPRVFPELSCSLRPFISARLCLGTAPVNARVGPCRLVTRPSLCSLPRWSRPWVVVAVAVPQADSWFQDLR